jgi:hypothetical protein
MSRSWRTEIGAARSFHCGACRPAERPSRPPRRSPSPSLCGCATTFIHWRAWRSASCRITCTLCGCFRWVMQTFRCAELDQEQVLAWAWVKTRSGLGRSLEPGLAQADAPDARLRELAPRPFGRPPDEFASGQNENAQGQPPIKSGGNEAGSKREHRHDHGEIIRPGVTAVGASASPCIEKACRSHPDKCNDPERRAHRHRAEQADNDRALRNPPRQQISAGPAQPVTRILELICRHAASPRTAGRRAAGSRTLGLDRRAWCRAIGAEYAAIARLRPQRRTAAGARIEKPTGIGRHCFGFCDGAMRAGDDGFKDHDLSYTI